MLFLLAFVSFLCVFSFARKCLYLMCAYWRVAEWLREIKVAIVVVAEFFVSTKMLLGGVKSLFLIFCSYMAHSWRNNMNLAGLKMANGMANGASHSAISQESPS